MRGEPARLGGAAREGVGRSWWPRPRTRSSGRAATRSCSAATRTCGRRARRRRSPSCASGSAWRPDRSARDRPHLRARARGGRSRRGSSRRSSASCRWRAGSASAVRPRTGHRPLRGGIVPRQGVRLRPQRRYQRGSREWRSVEAAEVREGEVGGSGRRSSSSKSSGSRSSGSAQQVVRRSKSSGAASRPAAAAPRSARSLELALVVGQAQRGRQEGRAGTRAPAEGAQGREDHRAHRVARRAQRRRRGQDRRRVPRGAPQEPDRPAGDGDAHA